MLRIGLTGGIGSGKTTVAHIFEVLGIPVYYADAAAKRIMHENEELKEQLIFHFGKETYLNGQLNRPYLAGIVFSDPEKTKLANSLIHPHTIADAAAWMEKQHAPYALKEAALIFEARADKELDLVIGVSSPFEMRISRAMQRDGISREAIISRMEKQMNEEEKMKRCDFVIQNDETILLIPQVIQVHEQLIRNLERVHN